jgi:hypothetical protein
MAGIVGLTELQHTNGNSMLTVATTGDGNVKSEGGAATTSLRQGLAKCWINYNMAFTSSIYGSYNVGSLTDNGTGDASVAYTSNMNNDDYAQVDGTGDEGEQFNNSRALGAASVGSAKTTSGTKFDTGGQTVNTNYDFKENCIVIHGDLA